MPRLEDFDIVFFLQMDTCKIATFNLLTACRDVAVVAVVVVVDVVDVVEVVADGVGADRGALPVID